MIKEKEALESKFHLKQLEQNESEQKLIKQINQQEKVIIIQNEKISNFEEKIKFLNEKLINTIDKQNMNKDSLFKQLSDQIQVLEKENLVLKEKNDKSELKVYEIKSNYEKEILLMENKILFLDSQKDNYKKEQQETANKYQESLLNLQNKSKLDLDRIERNYKDLIKNIERNYGFKYDEQIKMKDIEISHLKGLTGEIEKQLKVKDSIIENLKQQENITLPIESDMEERIKVKDKEREIMRIGYETKMKDLLYEFQNEKDLFKRRIGEYDKRINEVENKKSDLILEFEKEKTSLVREIDRLQGLIFELEESNSELKGKIKSNIGNKDFSQGKSFISKIQVSTVNKNQSSIKQLGNKIDMKEFLSRKDGYENTHRLKNDINIDDL